ncbi:MAG TPA: DNA mismatch repair endonuclease MutL [Terracidiphilus sp.]|nr:DNA mismatch repair endonuclease MutL [Terracidiphilus sp.]
MGRIRVLPDHVANQIAAGEVVDRPASVVKELLENALDAGATRIRVGVEAGGRKLIRIADDGQGMSRDDALLAFERHATSKLRTAEDLLSIATLGFRGEALPSIASVARVTLETSTGDPGQPGTRIEIAGGKILHVDDAALPRGTTLTVADLFFNTPARRKFLRAESTELSHVTALVTHYALVHPNKHFELVSASHTLVSAPPVARIAERIYQIFGKDTLAQLLPVAAETPLERAGLPEPPPWKKNPDDPVRDPGSLRVTGFYSKPELQKLNRNSIYIFVNKRLIRDRLLLHAITEAYRNIIPPTSSPVVLLFLEMPPEEVDVNVHPAKTEVRFRQQSLIHDFVRDSLRNALVKSRPAAGFLAALDSAPLASPSLMPPAASHVPGAAGPESPLPQETEPAMALQAESFRLSPQPLPAVVGRLPFDGAAMGVTQPEKPHWTEAAGALLRSVGPLPPAGCSPADSNSAAYPADPAAETARVEAEQAAANLNHLGSLRPLGQLRESFILAVGDDGLWIIDQHVAHERVLFEKILSERQVEKVQRQRLLMPLLVELKPWQMVTFAEIAEELDRNGFEAEPFGPHTLAVKAAPVGLEGQALERMLAEVIEQVADASIELAQKEDLSTLRRRIAASIACHSAIKINTPLDPVRMEWLLLELARTEHPTSCPHGRPIALLYSWKDIQRAFHRI